MACGAARGEAYELMSGFGTSRTSPDVRLESAKWASELDAARRMHDTVELEIRPGRKECRGDFVDRLSGAVRDEHDVGRRGERRKTASQNGY